MKKLLPFLIASLLPMAANAYDIKVANAYGVTIYYNYINNGAELEVTYQGDDYGSHLDRYQGSVVIPSEVNYMGKTCQVTSIGDDAFALCSKLSSVSIPSSVKSIGRNAFGCCYDLLSISIPNGVKSIEEGTFLLCHSLTSVSIPNSVTKIGNQAFLGCI